MVPARPQEIEQLRARQNPLTKFESWMQRIIEVPFARLFPSRVEPVEIARKLERAMEDNLLLQSEGRRLAPNVYDIYLSMKDHQQLSPSQAVLIRDWQQYSPILRWSCNAPGVAHYPATPSRSAGLPH